MDFTTLINTGINFYQTHTLIAIIIAVILGIYFYLKPKAMLKLMALFLLFAAAFYIFSLMGDMTVTGISQKKEMVDKIR